MEGSFAEVSKVKVSKVEVGDGELSAGEIGNVGLSVGTLVVGEGLATDDVVLRDDVVVPSVKTDVEEADEVGLVTVDKLVVATEVGADVTSFAPQTPFCAGAPSVDFR